jgi:hypothetical protein
MQIPMLPLLQKSLSWGICMVNHDRYMYIYSQINIS